MLLVAYAAILAARWRMGEQADRRTVIVSAMLVVGCILQFVAVVTFEANGTEKHFFIFNALVDVAMVLAILDIARVAELWWSRKVSTS